MASSDKNKIVAIILCLLGFGLVGGIHRFYVGKVWTGLLYLLTGGLFGIGTVLDLIKLITNTFKDARGLYVDKG